MNSDWLLIVFAALLFFSFLGFLFWTSQKNAKAKVSSQKGQGLSSKQEKAEEAKQISKEKKPMEPEAPSKKSAKSSKKSTAKKFHIESPNFVRNVPMITSTAQQFSWNLEGSRRHMALLVGDRLIKVYHIMKAYEDEKLVTIPSASITSDFDLSAVALSPDGHKVAAAQSYDISIDLYSFNLSSQKFVLVKKIGKKLHKYPINSIYFLYNAEYICTTSTDNDLQVKLWNSEGDQLANIATQQQKHYRSIANASRNVVMVLAESPITKVFEGKFVQKEMKSFNHVCSLGGNNFPVTEIAMTPCGNAAASLSIQDKTLKIFDIKSVDYPKPIQVVSLESLEGFQIDSKQVKIALEYTQEDDLILVVFQSNQLSVFNVSQNNKRIHFEENAHTSGSIPMQIEIKTVVSEIYAVTLASDSRVHLWRFLV